MRARTSQAGDRDGCNTRITRRRLLTRAAVAGAGAAAPGWLSGFANPEAVAAAQGPARRHAHAGPPSRSAVARPAEDAVRGPVAFSPVQHARVRGSELGRLSART